MILRRVEGDWMQETSEGAVLDPVCGMTVKAESPHELVHDGVLYRFCAARCAERFRADPSRFLNPNNLTENNLTPGTGPYTCPMHLEVVQEGPMHGTPQPIVADFVEPPGQHML